MNGFEKFNKKGNTYMQFVMPLSKEWKSKAVCFDLQTVTIIVIWRVVETKLAVTLLSAVRIHVILIWSCYKWKINRQNLPFLS